MNDAVFYLRIVLVDGKTLVTDNINMRAFISTHYATATNISLESCWTYVHTYFNNFINSNSASPVFTVGGRTTLVSRSSIAYIEFCVI